VRSWRDIPDAAEQGGLADIAQANKDQALRGAAQGDAPQGCIRFVQQGFAVCQFGWGIAGSGRAPVANAIHNMGVIRAELISAKNGPSRSW
jgi:hypothetical protein